MIPILPEYSNHLGTVYAIAIFALAEATRGEYLFNQFKDFHEDIIPVIRKVEVKYSKPAESMIFFSKASFADADLVFIMSELKSKS